jgi:hypothetical protein
MISLLHHQKSVAVSCMINKNQSQDEKTRMERDLITGDLVIRLYAHPKVLAGRLKSR